MFGNGGKKPTTAEPYNDNIKRCNIRNYFRTLRADGRRCTAHRLSPVSVRARPIRVTSTRVNAGIAAANGNERNAFRYEPGSFHAKLPRPVADEDLTRSPDQCPSRNREYFHGLGSRPRNVGVFLEFFSGERTVKRMD